MPPKHDKKLRAAKRTAHVAPPGRSDRFLELKKEHIRAAEAGRAPAHPSSTARLAERGHPMKKSAEG